MVLSVIARTPVPPQLSALAARQSGVLSREQAAGHGVSDEVAGRLVREGMWKPLAYGLYATGPPSFLQQAWAGVLIGGPRAVLGCQAAAYLHGLSTEAPETIVVYTGTTHPQRVDPRWRFVRVARLGSGDPPRTRLAQTVLDLAQDLSPDGIAALVERAMTQRHLRSSELLSLMSEYPRLRHRTLLREILGDTDHGVHGPLERRYYRDVERAHGLPVANRQVSVVSRFRCDVLYRPYPLVVELDGRAYHPDRWKDAERDNAHQVRGLATLRFGWQAVLRDPCEVARLVGTTLEHHGWATGIHSCPACFV